MKLSRRLKIVLIGVIAGIILMAIVYGGGYAAIQWDAHQKAKAIWKAYPQATDEVEAAILQMQSSSCAMKERNRAVWVLGRLSDKKALPALEHEYTGQPCDHTNCLCQSELKKAIRRCGGNIGSLKADMCDCDGLK